MKDLPTTTFLKEVNPSLNKIKFYLDWLVVLFRDRFTLQVSLELSSLIVFIELNDVLNSQFIAKDEFLWGRCSKRLNDSDSWAVRFSDSNEFSKSWAKGTIINVSDGELDLALQFLGSFVEDLFSSLSSFVFLVDQEDGWDGLSEDLLGGLLVERKDRLQPIRF